MIYNISLTLELKVIIRPIAILEGRGSGVDCVVSGVGMSTFLVFSTGTQTYWFSPRMFRDGGGDLFKSVEV